MSPDIEELLRGHSAKPVELIRQLCLGLAQVRSLDLDIEPAQPDLVAAARESELPLEQIGPLYSRLLAAEQRQRGGVHYTPPEVTARLAAATLVDTPGTRICDPAMGCGAFLLAALRQLEQRKLPLDGLHGMDADPDAVELARLTLWLASDGRLELDRLRRQLRVGDSLLEPVREAFDVILGNPPYVENKRIDKAYKQALADSGYTCLRGLWDLSVPFVERCSQLLRPGGVMGLVLPNKLATRDFGEPLRRLLTERHQLLELTDVSELDLFGGAHVYPILAVVRRERPAADHRVTIQPAGGVSPIRPRQAQLARTPKTIWTLSRGVELVHAVLDRVGQQARSLGEDLGRRVYRPLGFKWASMLDHVCPEPTPGAYRFIGCGSLAPLEIRWDRGLTLQRRSFERAWLTRPASASDKQWSVFGRPQLLVRELARELTAAVDLAGEYAHLTGIYGYVDLEPDFPVDYLAGLLNSDLLRGFYDRLFWNTHLNGGYLDFKGSYLALLPIVPAPRKTRERIRELALELGRTDSAAGWSELNQAVNPLYGLPPDWRSDA